MKHFTRTFLCLATVALILAGAACSGSGGGDETAPVPVPTVVEPETPILNAVPIYGEAPATDVPGLQVLSLGSIPNSDVFQSGRSLALLITFDNATFKQLSGAIVQKEGDPYYFDLPITIFPDGTAVLMMEITDGYPDGDYTLLIAMEDKNGNVGNYIRIIIHIADIPDLVVTGLYPEAATPNPETRTLEHLNVVGRAVFSREVAFSDFTLGMLDAADNPVTGEVRIIPGNMSATFIPYELLQPSSQYRIVAHLLEDDILYVNPFYTDDTTPLANPANLVGRVFSFRLEGDNIVEPEAAKLVFATLGDAIPPFLMVITDVDTVNHTFSAYAGVATVVDQITGELKQDYRVPTFNFAQQSSFQDPYFLAGPGILPLTFSFQNKIFSIYFHDLTISGQFSADLSGFDKGSIGLYLDPDEIQALLEEFLDGTFDDVCGALQEFAHFEVCDITGKIRARAEDVTGAYEPGITELISLDPDPPSPDVISAGAGGTISLAGTMTSNGIPMGAGYQIHISPDTGVPASSIVLTDANGRFSGSVNVSANTATPGVDIDILLDCLDYSAIGPENMERHVSVAVDP